MAPARGRTPKGPDVDLAFGRVLRKLRETRGLSQEQLAHIAESGRTFISELERGEKGASLKTVFRLAPHVGVSPSEIVERMDAILGGRR